MRYVLAAISIVILFIVVPLNQNMYNYQFNVLICNNGYSCIHEVGHRMDDDLSRPSKSEEFGNALRVTLIYSAKTDDWNEYSKLILTYGGVLQYNQSYSVTGVERFSSPQEELYADIYRLSGGNVDNIPVQLQSFYSKDTKYQELIQCLDSNSVCGSSFRMRPNRPD